MKDETRDLGWPELLDRLEATLGSAARSPQDTTEPVGDDLAWREFSRRVWQYVALAGRWNTRLTPPDLEDLAQDLLIQFVSPMGLRRLREAQAPGPYLLSAARNRVLNLIRNDQRAEQAISALGRELADAVEDQGSTPIGAPLDGPVENDELRRALARLSSGDWNLLRDRFWRGLPIGEIARERGLSYSTVAVRIFRTIRVLRAELGQASPLGRRVQ
jgi:RNA polymerase sigma factor (sigma-70 family)